MISFPILDLVIGIVFIFFLLSIICSSAVELWFSLLNTRAKLLAKWLEQIFNADARNSDGTPANITVGQAIIDHCMITALSKTGKSTSYIDAENFVSALLDKITISAPAADAVVGAAQLPPTTLPAYIAAIQNSDLISGELKRTILSLANEATLAASAINNIPQVASITNNILTDIKSDMQIFHERLERWYDTNADRLTGTLKRKKSLPATFILATILTLGLNTDTIEISKYLYSNKDESKKLAETAIGFSQKLNEKINTVTSVDSTDSSSVLKDLTKKADDLKDEINSLHALDIPMGWDGINFWEYSKQPKHLFGWLATILAICMGAPFWFDTLNKLANLRGTGPKPVSASEANEKKP